MFASIIHKEAASEIMFAAGRTSDRKRFRYLAHHTDVAQSDRLRGLKV